LLVLERSVSIAAENANRDRSSAIGGRMPQQIDQEIDFTAAAPG
jgi:hypothetical protein